MRKTSLIIALLFLVLSSKTSAKKTSDTVRLKQSLRTLYVVTTKATDTFAEIIIPDSVQNYTGIERIIKRHRDTTVFRNKLLIVSSFWTPWKSQQWIADEYYWDAKNFAFVEKLKQPNKTLDVSIMLLIIGIIIGSLSYSIMSREKPFTIYYYLLFPVATFLVAVLSVMTEIEAESGLHFNLSGTEMLLHSVSFFMYNMIIACLVGVATFFIKKRRSC